MPLRGGLLGLAIGANELHPCGAVRCFAETCAASSYLAVRCCIIRAQASRTPRSRPAIRPRCSDFCLFHRSGPRAVPLDPLWAQSPCGSVGRRLCLFSSCSLQEPPQWNLAPGLAPGCLRPAPAERFPGLRSFPRSGIRSRGHLEGFTARLEDRQKSHLPPFAERQDQGRLSVQSVGSFPTTALRRVVPWPQLSTNGSPLSGQPRPGRGPGDLCTACRSVKKVQKVVRQ